MAKRPREVRVYRDAHFLAHCDSKEARQWLSEKNVEFSSTFRTPETPPESHVLEYILYRRRDPLINIALAEHGRSRSVLQRIYKDGNDSIRTTACSNASLFIGDTKTGAPSWFRHPTFIWEIVENGSLGELKALCENPHVPDWFFMEVPSLSGYTEKSSELDIELSETRYLYMLGFLAENPRLRTAREDSEERHYSDGYANFQYNQVFDAFWELAGVAPVNNEWAFILSRVFRNLYAPIGALKGKYKVLERWQVDDEGKFAPTIELRTELAKKHIKPHLAMVTSDDVAIRQAFYATFDPEQKEFKDLDWDEWLERDDSPNFYLDINLNVLASTVGRQKLRALLSAISDKEGYYDTVQIGWFDAAKERYRESNPEWFVDEDKEWMGDDEPEIDPITELTILNQNTNRKLNKFYDEAKSLFLIGIGGVIAFVVIKAVKSWFN